MSRLGEILEYPYQGKITHVTPGVGRASDTRSLLYEGMMDSHMVVDDQGRLLQSSPYIISMPMVNDAERKLILPSKGDEIEVLVYGETLLLTIENVEPSLLGGISLYASRKSW